MMSSLFQRSFLCGLLIASAILGLTVDEVCAQRPNAPYGYMVWYKMRDGSTFSDGSSFKILLVTRNAAQANQKFQEYNTVHRYLAYRQEIPNQETYLKVLQQMNQPQRPASLYTVGETVQVNWKGKWWKARVLKVNGNQYYITYPGYDSSWNEWVGPSRIRKN